MPDNLQKLLSCTCVAVLPPEQHQPIPHGVPAPLRIWANRDKFWAKTTLRVRFINGDSKQREAAKAQMRAIDDLCGIAFKFVTWGPSDIRVAFNRGGGHWSYVGTDCAGIPQHYQTMNVDLSGRDATSEWRRVVQHETLHALGFNHEHQHPRNTIPWNVEAVYAFYGQTQGWSHAEIDAQVLRRGSSRNFFGTEQDLESIMQYPVPKELVTDPAYAVGWNSKLSPMDISTLKQAYP